MSAEGIDFRPLTRADFPLLAAWLDEPLVARWWHHESTPAALERDFGPALDQAEPTEIFLAAEVGEPFGLIQRYRIDAYPEYDAELAAVCVLPPRALSIDYLIGDADHRGRGLGAAMIASFVTASWVKHPSAESIIVPVAVGNVASWRALERAGLERIGTVSLQPDNPIDPPDHHLYRIDRGSHVLHADPH